MLENNWIKYYLKETDSDKSFEQVTEHLNGSNESFKLLAIRSFKSKLQLDESAAKKEYIKLRKKYILRYVGRLGILLFLISIPVVIGCWTKLFPPKSHLEILSEYLHGHFNKDHKTVKKHHANNVVKYWDMNKPNKDQIASRNSEVWDNTGFSKLEIDSIISVDSPVYYIHYWAFKDSADLDIKKTRCLRVEFIGKKILEVGPCDKIIEEQYKKETIESSISKQTTKLPEERAMPNKVRTKVKNEVETKKERTKYKASPKNVTTKKVTTKKSRQKIKKKKTINETQTKTKKASSVELIENPGPVNYE